MSKRPIIGVATQTQDAIPGELPACWIMGQRYVHALRAVGGVPWIIPLVPEDPDTLREIFDRLDGVFLTGGVDVDPAAYGEVKQKYCGRTDPPRDRVEIQLIRWAQEAGTPVLAVCRGIQILNVALGGSLYQDVSAQMPDAIRHDYFPTRENPARDYLAHPVTIVGGTRLAESIGERATPVNSMHHQAIKRLGEGLIISAEAPDGVIEGVEGSNGRYLVGVQWHPEELIESHAGMRRLFAAFIDAAVRF